MKWIVLVFLILSFACTIDRTDEGKQVKNLDKHISTLLDHWHEDAAEARFEPYFSLFSSQGIYIGTDAKEVWTVDEFKSFAKPYFDKGKAWSFTAKGRNIYTSNDGNIVWFDELLDTWMGTCRGSGVFQKYDEKWKLEHYVLSLTIPNDKMDSVISEIH